MYDSSHSEASWIADWQMLATRYASDTSVIGADLHNEPYNGTWGDGGTNDWAAPPPPPAMPSRRQ